LIRSPYAGPPTALVEEKVSKFVSLHEDVIKILRDVYRRLDIRIDAPAGAPQ